MKPSPAQVREALIKSASPCDPLRGSDCRRFLAGRLNIQAAYTHLFIGENIMSDTNENSDVNFSVASSESSPEALGLVLQEFSPSDQAIPAVAISDASIATASSMGGLSQSSACGCKPSSKSMVYALGKLGYDFGTEARRDGFTQLMGDKKVLSIPKTSWALSRIAHMNQKC